MVERRELLSRLAVGPRFLILGQGSRAESIAALKDKDGPGFPIELDILRRVDPPGHAEWKAFDAAASSWTDRPGDQEVRDFPWNGVFTSRVDTSVVAGFNSTWRRIVPTASGETGRHPRSASELQFRFLYGGLGLPEDERPAADEIQLLDWQRRSNDILTTLATRLVTPRGIVVVEDWYIDDWLSPADMYNFASRLAPGQVHIFSAPDELYENRLLQTASRRGFVGLHREALSEVVSEASELGLLGESPDSSIGRSRRLLPVGAAFVEIGTGIWNQVIASARPVDLELLEPFPPASDALTYQRFRSFLGSAEGAPPWRAIASGMKLRRDYERDLLGTVRNVLRSTDGEGPVIVHGQTASGKSLGLTWLAQELARSGEVAVLHQSRRRERPNASDLEAFGSWAESVSGLRTVLIWDGMAEPDEYHALQRQLRARGQRVLVIGSSYLAEASGERYVRAPIALSSREVDRLGTWLESHNVHLPAVRAGSDASFLALLYRALPETERGLRLGLGLEMRAAESGMETLAKDKRGLSDNRLTAVAQALMSAGFDFQALAPSDHPDGEVGELAFEQRSIAERLSAIILTVGRRGLAVPLELVLRLVGREGMTTIVEFMRRFDIFRWTEDVNGDQYLGARTTLEAELLARDDLPTSVEADIIGSLIRNLNVASTRAGGAEVQLVIDLLEQVGPQSSLPSRFGPWFGDFAAAFRDLRGSTGASHPRLVLAEANLLREYARRTQSDESLSQPDRMALLIEAEDLLEQTLQEVDVSGRGGLNLWVELAASLGAQVVQSTHLSDHPDAESIMGLMSRLRGAVMKARSIDPENAYPVDVIAWAARDAVQTGVLSPAQQVELLAEAQASLDSLEIDTLSPKQKAIYSSRQADVAKLLGDDALQTKFLTELMSNEDPAAYYLLAGRAAKLGAEGRKAALATLLGAPEEVRHDWKCSRMLLDLFWLDLTGNRLLRGEREKLALDAAQWQECLDLVETMRSAAGFDRYRVDFVRGLSLFHLGAIKASQTVFRDLGSMPLDLGVRVVSTYLASNEAGDAIEFTGRVLSASPDRRRGRVWVDQLRAEVDFIPIRFSTTEFGSRNEVLPPFHIAFNFRGPVADPIRHTRG